MARKGKLDAESAAGVEFFQTLPISVTMARGSPSVSHDGIKTIPLRRTTGVMFHEHEQGQSFIRAIVRRSMPAREMQSHWRSLGRMPQHVNMLSEHIRRRITCLQWRIMP